MEFWNFENFDFWKNIFFENTFLKNLKEGFTNIIGSSKSSEFLEVTLKWSGTLRNFYLQDIDLLEIVPHDYQRIRNHSEHSRMDLDDLSFTYNDNWAFNTVMERFRRPNRFIILVKPSFKGQFSGKHHDKGSGKLHFYINSLLFKLWFK